MHTFTDLNDKEWKLVLNIGAMDRIKDEAGVDLLGIEPGKAIEGLADNLRQFVDVLWSVCKKQAEADGVTPEQFAEGLGGEVLEQATTAFMRELADFFPRRLDRLAARHAMEKQEAMTAKAESKLDELVNGPEMEKAIQDQLDRAGRSFIESLDSSA